ncbi:MAG: NAD(P)/FAD-dependent oxidoreductase [Candidatus Velthaea sp.]|jgi:all-trans-retinol 13,14-reductase
MIATAYKHSTLASEYDAIVIGSGIGGLSVAALLAKHAAQRVLVLERHYTAGGFTHVFARPGFEWDVGVHYVGRVADSRSRERAAFDHVTEGRLRWQALPEIFDRIRIGELHFDVAAGTERYRDDLRRQFPAERKAIDGYLGAVHAVARASALFWAEKVVPAAIEKLAGSAMRGPFLRYARRTTADVLSDFTTNRELRAILTAQWGNYGLAPGRSSFAMHAIIAHHYLEGAAYPAGGAASIAAAIAPAIERAGGAIVVAAEVAEILIERDRAVGVRIADGREIRAQTVISDAGAAATFGSLIAPAAASRLRTTRLLQTLEPSMAHLCLYVGMTGPACGGDVAASNLWIHPGLDFDANVARSAADPEAAFPLLFISYPSAKDPTFAARFPDRATAEIVVPAPFGWFEPWANSHWKRRGASYDAFKARLTERLLGEFALAAPEASRRVAYAELSTPLSTRHFANAARGATYGTSATPARFLSRTIGPRTPIRGLFLTGTDACSEGVTGALFGGILAASAILGRNLLGEMNRPANARAAARTRRPPR